jgi:uncharacterized membrane protein YkvA (DUF1232 family)
VGRLRRVLALLTDPRTPRLPRVAVAMAVVYLLWPADLVPELVVPVVGWLDDLTLLWMALRWLVRSGPKEPVPPTALRAPDEPEAPR